VNILVKHPRSGLHVAMQIVVSTITITIPMGSYLKFISFEFGSSKRRYHFRACKWESKFICLYGYLGLPGFIVVHVNWYYTRNRPIGHLAGESYKNVVNHVNMLFLSIFVS